MRETNSGDGWETTVDRDTAAAWPDTLSAPARRALDQAGYTRLDQLVGASEGALLRLHGLGPKAISSLRVALADEGLALSP